MKKIILIGKKDLKRPISLLTTGFVSVKIMEA